MTNQQTMIMLTGDRPTGPLHLGHYAGSICNRLKLQSEPGRKFLMIADTQAFTDNMNDLSKIRTSILHLAADYVGCGIDPGETVIFLQSAVPELAELGQLFMNLATVSRLERIPTVKAEIEQRRFERDVPAGFLCYPIAQAADIAGFRATHVPVGEDQLPMIEITVETVRKINRLSGRDTLVEPRAVLSTTARLPGIDGQAKASKSLGNAIYLSDTDDEIKRKVMLMYTDPDHLKVSDPGKIEGNVVFAYLDAFHPNRSEVDALKGHYQLGGLGDVKLKRLLIDVLVSLIAPIREKREAAYGDPSALFALLREGSCKAREVVGQTLAHLKTDLGMLVL